MTMSEASMMELDVAQELDQSYVETPSSRSSGDNSEPPGDDTLDSRTNDSTTQSKKANVDKWRYTEILELLKLAHNMGYQDFHQIANKMKGIKDAVGRPKGYYSAATCEAQFRHLISSTKNDPQHKEFFDKLGTYSERWHVKRLLDQYKEYDKIISDLVQKVVLNDDLKNCLLSYFNKKLDSRYITRVEQLLEVIPAIVNWAATFEDQKAMVRHAKLYSNFVTPAERKSVDSIADLRKLVRERHQELLVRRELSDLPTLPPEFAASSTVASAKTSPKVNIAATSGAASAASDEKIPRKRPGVSINSQKSPVPSVATPSAVEPPSKKRRTSSRFDTVEDSVSFDESRFSSATPAPKDTSLVELEPVYKNDKGVFVQNFAGQTLLVMIDMNPERLDRAPFRKMPPAKTPKGAKARSISCQTVAFCLTPEDPFRWNDEAVPCHPSTSRLINGFYHTDSRFVRSKSIATTFTIHEHGLKTAFYRELRKSPLYRLVRDLCALDTQFYFQLPVRYEIPNYGRLVKQPMDFQAIEDLIVAGEIRSLADLELHVALIAANGVAFNAIRKDTQNFLYAAFRRMF